MGIRRRNAKRRARLLTIAIVGIITLYLLIFFSLQVTFCAAGDIAATAPGKFTLWSSTRNPEILATSPDSITKFSFGAASFPGQTDTEASYIPPQRTYRWGEHFFCDANFADFSVGLFTLILALSTIYLWLETERLAEGGEEQAEQTTKSIAQASRSAAALERAAEALGQSTSALERRLRADVYLELAHITDVENGRTPVAHIQIRNFGDTRAIDVGHFQTIRIAEFPLNTELPIEGDVSLGSRFILPADGYRTGDVAFPRPIDQQLWQKLQAGTHAIYVTGVISFRDLFSSEIRVSRYKLAHSLQSPLGSTYLSDC